MLSTARTRIPANTASCVLVKSKSDTIWWRLESVVGMVVSWISVLEKRKLRGMWESNLWYCTVCDWFQKNAQNVFVLFVEGDANPFFPRQKNWTRTANHCPFSRQLTPWLRRIVYCLAIQGPMDCSWVIEIASSWVFQQQQDDNKALFSTLCFISGAMPSNQSSIPLLREGRTNLS